MKKILVLLSIYTLCFYIANAQGAKSLLWEISGNNLEKPSYLFGTIHLICPEDFIMGEEVKKAFTSTEALLLELDFDDPSMLSELQVRMMLPEGESLKNIISEEDYILFDSYFKEKMGMGMDFLSKMKPMALMSMSMSFIITCQPKSYEDVFSQMAKEEGKEILGLEKVSFQIDLFDSIPYKSQVDMISEIIRNQDKAKSEFIEMVRLYKEQDINALSLMMDTSLTNVKNSNDLLVNNRNRNWIPVLEEVMKQRSVFVAFGAAHLPGEMGVLELLRKKGYIVKPVRLLN